MWLCPWFLYNIGLCSSGGCCTDQSFASNGVCFLPADSGPCNDQYDLRWYHDPRSGLCRQFMYGGCGGNANNFLTKSNCVEACNAFPADTDFCKMPMDRGPCTAHYEKWYYDESNGRCHPFIFGGCDGNDNRFDSEEECLTGCIKATEAAFDVPVPKSASDCRSPMTESPTICAVESPERCLLPLYRGPCHGSIPRWYFDLTARECLPFAYGGCHGNRNRFLTREICLTQCRSKVSPENARGSHVQSSPVVTTRPIANTLKITEENGHRRTTDAPNGPQERNGDNGGRETEGVEVAVNGAIVFVCLLSKDPGPCSDYTPLWYFDAASDTCRRFRYGGCQGNANRFASLEDCHRTCLEQESRQELQEHQQPTIAWKKGPHFQAAILTLHEGRSHPLLPPLPPVRTEPPLRTVPSLRMEPSLRGKLPLRRAQTTTTEQWQQQQQQQQGGPKIRKTQAVFDEAEQQMDHDGAWQHDESIRVEDDASVEQKSTEEDDRNPASENDDVPSTKGGRCSLPEDRGSLCAKWRIYWLHDDHVSTCRRFYYGGCDGNENRFKTKEECEAACPEPI